MFKANYIFTPKDLETFVVFGETTESIVLEFKRELKIDENKDKVALELACDICQFANTWGGTILVGVEEVTKISHNIKIANGFLNVNNVEKIKQFVNDLVRRYYYPNNIDIEIVSIIVGKDLVLAINIYPLINSLASVSSPSKPDYLLFPIRTEYGKKYLKPFEVEKRMNDRKRALVLELSLLWKQNKEVELFSNIIKEDLSPQAIWDNREINVTIVECFENEFQLKINNLFLNLPYSLIKDIWNTYDNKIGMILDATIIISSDRKSIRFKI